MKKKKKQKKKNKHTHTQKVENRGAKTQKRRLTEEPINIYGDDL